MQCPRCQSEEYSLTFACPDCGFSGNGRSLEHLSNLNFLLGEMAGWSLPATYRDPLRQHYRRQRRAVAVELGLRPPPPNDLEALVLRLELSKRHCLRDALDIWWQRGWVETAVATPIQDEITAALAAISDQLEDAPPPPASLPETKHLSHRWEEQQYLLTTLAHLREAGGINETAYHLAAALIMQEIEQLEIRMGLRAPAVPPPLSPKPRFSPKGLRPWQRGKAAADALPAAADAFPAVAITRPKRPQLTWDRVWESLLSERTLHAILFLGVILLFGSGVSWVAWNWNTFPPIAQIGFLGSFTALFYGLGWYVQTRMALRGSGIALTAVASLLVPLDFVAFYISGGFPAGTWPQVWLLTSLVSLAAYALAAYLLQAEFFGYLLGAALISLALSVLQLFGLAVDWWPLGVMAVALLLVLSGQFPPYTPQKWRFLGNPLAEMGLVTAVPIMLVSFARTFLSDRDTIPFALAAAFAWWLGGVTLTLSTSRLRMRLLAWAAAVAFPIAAWLTARVLLNIWHVHSAWYALGWALLAPAYLLTGWRLRRLDDELKQEYGYTAVAVGWLLVILSGFWALTHVQATALIHPLLALVMLLVALLWQDARPLWLLSLLLITGSGAWQAGRGATPAELALPWALLSILHIVAALRLRSQAFQKKPGFWSLSEKPGFWSPLYGAAVASAALALLPPLLLLNRPLLIYALGNWIGLNGWLAYLAYRQSEPALQTLLARPRLQKMRPALFHWLAALPLVGWVWLLWVNNSAASGELALLYAVFAWGVLWLCLRLRRLHWEYGRPWQMAAHLSNVVALVLLMSTRAPLSWATITLFAASAFYIAAVWLLHKPRAFYVGGLLLPVVLISGARWLRLDMVFWPALLSAIPGAYILLALRLEQALDQPRRVTAPMYRVGFWLTAVGLASALVGMAYYWSDTDLLWIAAAPLLVGAAFALYAWQFDAGVWAHASIWTFTLGGGLLVKVFSHGSGRSAVLIALLSIVYISLERRLCHLAHTQPKAVFFRNAWRLYRRPLLIAGWLISVAAIFAALVRNLVWLGGGPTRELWAIVALTLVSGLYAAAAALFRKRHFAWLASGLAVIPWTLLTHWLFGAVGAWYSVSWVILALALLAAGVRLAQLVGLGVWSWPPLIVAHALVPYALLWGLADTAVSTLSFALAIAFYLGATWVDYQFNRPTPAAPHSTRHARFLYHATILLPIWATFLLRLLLPDISQTGIGLLVLTFAWPLLAVGRRVARWEAAYRWPLYLVAYGTAVVAMLLVSPDRPALIGVLLFNTALAALSARIFREPAWIFPAAVLFPMALGLIQMEWGWDREHFFGWMLEGTAAVYLALAWLLEKFKLRWYAMPLLWMMGLLVIAGLPPSLATTTGALVGFGLGALVYALTAVWQRWAWLFHVAVGITVVPYWAAVDLLNVRLDDYGLAAWPGIVLALLLARWLDAAWGMEPTLMGQKFNDPFPWADVVAWPRAVWLRVTRWWALALYGAAFAGAALSSLPAVESEWRWFVCLGLGTAVFFYALFRFRLRIWLLVAWLWLQFTALAAIRWLGLTDTPVQVALAFMPMTALTLFAGLLVMELRRERPLLTVTDRRWQLHLGGWSLPLFLLLFANIGIGQLLALIGGGAGTLVTLLHGVMVGVLASFWGLGMLAYLSLTFGFGALMQMVVWLDWSEMAYPVALAVLAAAYGLVGYGLRLWRPEVRAFWAWAGVWERPFYRSGWLVSGLSLLWSILLGAGVLLLLLAAFSYRPQLDPMAAQQVLMIARTFLLLGLFYLVAALVEKRPRLSYLALWLLLSAWSVWLLLLQGARELQLFALPAGVYLLLVGWLEWQRGLTKVDGGSRAAARWIDRAGALLLLGSAFWQSFGSNGGWYALLMIVEGLLLVWLGSLRRLRRLLYAGVAGVVTAVAGQLVEPLLELNTYVLLLLGALLVGLGIGLERRLENARKLSQEFRARLELWE